MIVTATASGGDDEVATTAITISSDAIVWDTVVDIADVRLSSLAAAGPGFVAVGHEVTQPGSFPPRVPVVVTSSDGLRWTAAATVDTSPFAFGEMHEVAIVGSGLVATGSVSNAGAQVVPAVWTSSDGLTWNMATPFGSVEGDVGTAIAAGAGGVVAIVSVLGESSVTAVATWWSPDGVDWTPTPGPGPFVPGVTTVRELVAFGTGFVAVGGDRSLSSGPVVWTSPDGRTWDGPNPLPVGPDTDSSFARGVGTDGATLLVVGDDVEFDPGAGPARAGASIWMSFDAVDWVQVPPAELDGDAVLDAVTADDALRYGDGWIVLGTTWTHEDRSVGLVWRGATG